MQIPEETAELDRAKAVKEAANEAQRATFPPIPTDALMWGAQTQQLTPDPAKAHRRKPDTRY